MRNLYFTVTANSYNDGVEQVLEGTKDVVLYEIKDNLPQGLVTLTIDLSEITLIVLQEWLNANGHDASQCELIQL